MKILVVSSLILLCIHFSLSESQYFTTENKQNELMQKEQQLQSQKEQLPKQQPDQEKQTKQQPDQEKQTKQQQPDQEKQTKQQPDQEKQTKQQPDQEKQTKQPDQIKQPKQQQPDQIKQPIQKSDQEKQTKQQPDQIKQPIQQQPDQIKPSEGDKVQPGINLLNFLQVSGCSADIQSHCSSAVSNTNFNYMVLLMCLDQGNLQLTSDCESTLYNYKVSLAEQSQPGTALDDNCQREIAQFCTDSQDGQETVQCLVQGLTSTNANAYTRNCFTYTRLLSKVLLADYRLLYDLSVDCKDEIYKYECVVGNHRGDMESPLGAVTACLEEKLYHLSDNCRYKVLTRARIQGIETDLDPQLNMACSKEFKRICNNYPIEKEDDAYKCLFTHFTDSQMSENCRKHILRRERMEFYDFTISHSFFKYCGTIIHDKNCTTDAQKSTGEMTRLLGVLQCLEADADTFSPECMDELHLMKDKLLGGYEINEELANACDDERQKYCKIEHEDGFGSILECLLTQYQIKQSEISQKCVTQLSRLVEIAEPLDNYYTNVILQMKCQSTAEDLCHDHLVNDDTSIIDCLFDNIDSTIMESKCKQYLSHMLYFESHVLEEDILLHDDCEAEKKTLCEINNQDIISFDSNTYTITCLFTIFADNETNLGTPCKERLKEVLSIRASTLDLDPALHEVCIEELGLYCMEDDNEHETQLKCLQFVLNEMQEDSKCRQRLESYTKIELKFPKINKQLYVACSKMIKMKCPTSQDTEIVDCLVKHKQDIDFPFNCKQALIDTQVIRKNNWDFDPVLAQYCQVDIDRANCSASVNVDELINCLYTVESQGKFEISKSCQPVIREKILERQQNIKLYPLLDKHCKNYTRNLCKNVQHDESKVLECLREHRLEIYGKCRIYISMEVQIEVQDPTLDITLMENCKKEKSTDCEGSFQFYLSCLTKHKSDSKMSSMCLKIVINRELEIGMQRRLDQTFKSACANEYAQCNDKKEDLFDCVMRFEKSFSKPCAIEVDRIHYEMSSDIRMNEQLMQHCNSEILTECSNTAVSKGRGQIIYCLKRSIKKIIKINKMSCVDELLKTIQRAQVDINSDADLKLKCENDLAAHCSDSPNIAKVRCLYDKLKKTPELLTLTCKNAIQDRIDLWKNLSEDHEDIKRGMVALLKQSGVVLNMAQTSIKKGQMKLGSLKIYFGIIFIIIFFTLCFLGRRVMRLRSLRRKLFN